MAGEEGDAVATIQLHTTVLPGGRIELVSPELPVGQPVTVTIAVKEPTAPPPLTRQNLLEWLDSLPPSDKTAEEWEQFERDFQAERDSWDR
jgi:hypothetical protein